jgi:hexosaminidase
VAVGLAGLATATGLAAVAQGAMAAATTPRLIPGPQRWTPGPGGYTFAPGARIVVLDQDLLRTASVFATDLRVLTGVQVDWRLGGAARPGDITLGIGLAEGGAEAYRLAVSSTLDVRGSEAGVFYGTRTILQLLHQSWAIRGGTAEDWPAYPERGLMLDVGRKYFSLSFLRKQIRELAYLKLNYLHLHLSDNLGFRLESATHPEITSDQHYTKAELRELIEYAARHHVQLVPEIDAPGHMEAVLVHHPELRLAGRVGVLDLSKPDSYALVEDLITEFLPLFPSRYWHIGADEYPAPDQDAFSRFVNWADGLVRSAGKTTRMWNDGIKPGVAINPDIVVEHWSAGGRTPWIGPALTPRELHRGRAPDPERRVHPDLPDHGRPRGVLQRAARPHVRRLEPQRVRGRLHALRRRARAEPRVARARVVRRPRRQNRGRDRHRARSSAAGAGPAHLGRTQDRAAPTCCSNR